MARSPKTFWYAWPDDNYLYALFPTDGREKISTLTLNSIPSLTKEQALEKVQQEEAFIPLDPSTVYSVVIHSTTTTDLNALDQEWVEKTTPGGSGAYKHMPFHFLVDSLGTVTEGRSVDATAGFRDSPWTVMNNYLHICYCASDPEPHDADSAVLAVIKKIVDWRFEGGFSKIRRDQIYIHSSLPGRNAPAKPGCGNAFGMCAQRAAGRWRLIHPQYSRYVPEAVDGTYQEIISAMVLDEAMKRGHTWPEIPTQTSTPTSPGPAIPNSSPNIPFN